MIKFTDKQHCFVLEYLVDLNATQAAIRAGYSGKTAAQIGERLLRKPQVAKAIQNAMKERGVRTELTVDRVILEVAHIAFFDIAEAFDADGRLKPLDKTSEDVRRAITGLEVITRIEEGVSISTLNKVKLADKLKALELLGRHLGMFNDKLTLAGDQENPLVLLLRQVQGTALKLGPQRVVGGVV